MNESQLSSDHDLNLGPSEAPSAPFAANTGHVPEVHESPHTRGAVQKNKGYCREIWSTWWNGRNSSEKVTGEKQS